MRQEVSLQHWCVFQKSRAFQSRREWRVALNPQVFALSVGARNDRPYESSKSCSHLQQAKRMGWAPLHSSPCIHFPGLLFLSPATEVTAIEASWHRCACRRVARSVQRFCAFVIGTWSQEVGVPFWAFASRRNPCPPWTAKYVGPLLKHARGFFCRLFFHR